MLNHLLFRLHNPPLQPCQQRQQQASARYRNRIDPKALHSGQLHHLDHLLAAHYMAPTHQVKRAS